MDIGIVGFGGVGRALVQLIHDKREELAEDGLELRIKYMISSRAGIYNPGGFDLEEFLSFMDGKRDLSLYEGESIKKASFEDIIKNKDIDMLVEVTSTNLEDGEPGMSHIRRALAEGISVVTANKGPILLAYDSLKALADEKGVALGIGCTTGGALPSINAGLVDLAGSRITSIEGILNGTTNFILEEMENRGLGYEEALKKAQDLGIAEKDPTMDVSGLDTASKLLILTNVLMRKNKRLTDVELVGLETISLEDVEKAAKEGKRYKLIGRTVYEDGELKIAVKPELVDEKDIFYHVGGKDKIVRYNSDGLGDLTIIGGASGVRPAAASILRDIVNNRGTIAEQWWSIPFQ